MGDGLLRNIVHGRDINTTKMHPSTCMLVYLSNVSDFMMNFDFMKVVLVRSVSMNQVIPGQRRSTSAEANCRRWQFQNASSKRKIH